MYTFRLPATAFKNSDKFWNTTSAHLQGLKQVIVGFKTSKFMIVYITSTTQFQAATRKSCWEKTLTLTFTEAILGSSHRKSMMSVWLSARISKYSHVLFSNDEISSF